MCRPTARPTPTPSPCTGKTYNIQSFDSCYSISKSQGIGTAWLLTDNNLLAYCADFPRKGDMCLINTCRVYTIQPNDTCMSIVGMFNITAAQVKAWNPVVQISELVRKHKLIRPPRSSTPAATISLT